MSEPQKTEQTGVRPTLIVGLGGTGKQTLLQLRRMLLDASDDGKPTLPYTQFLMIDSDVRAVNLDGKDIDEFFQACQFNEDERIETPLAPTDLDRLQTHGQEYPHIFAWFDPSLLTLPRPRDGNSQIRSFGRYAFITYYTRIRQRLEEIRDKLKDNQLRSRVAAEFNVELDMNQVDCWVVFSIAGGTGAGMFIDMAYLLKDVFPQIKLQAVAVAPDLFARPDVQTDEWARRAFGNGYASLMELENYNYMRDLNPSATDARFRVFWTRELFQQNATRNPGVFEMTWLMGAAPRSNAGDVMPNDKEDITQMVAEWLFMQIGSREGTLARSMNSRSSNWLSIVNLPAELNFTVDGRKITMGASKAYGSLGLSKIFVPSGLIETLHMHRLTEDVVRVWLEPTDTASITDAVEERFAERLLLRDGPDGERGHALRQRLYTSEGSDLFSKIDERFAQKRADTRRPAEGARKGIEKWIRQDVELALINEPDPNPERRGDFVKLVDRTHFDQAAGALEGELDGILSEITRSPQERLTYAAAALKEMQRRYNLIADEQKGRAKEREEEIKLHRSCADKLLAWSDDHGDFERGACIEVALEQYCRSMKARLSRVSHLAAARLAERMSAYIGQGSVKTRAGDVKEVVGKGLLKDLDDLDANIEVLLKRLTDRESALKSLRHSTLNQEVDPSEVEQADTYKLKDGRSIDKNVTYEVESRMYDQGDLGGDSPWHLRRILIGAGRTKLIEKMLYQARKELQPITFETFDVLSEMNTQFGTDEGKYLAKVRKLNEFAAPRWAAPSGHVSRAGNPADKTVNFVMLPPAGDLTDPNHRDEFSKKLGMITTGNIANVDGPKDAVFLIKHILDLTLAEWPGLSSWRTAYERITDSRIENPAGSVLHTTMAVDLLPEILPPDTVEAGRLLESLTICAQAVALGILEGRWEDDSRRSITWSMKRKTVFGNETRAYGRFSSAVREVRQGTDRGNMLSTATDSAIRQLTAEQRVRAVTVLGLLLNDLTADNPKMSPAYALKRSQPGWQVALETARTRLAAGNVTEAAIGDVWARRDEWFVEAPEASGFYRIAAEAPVSA